MDKLKEIYTIISWLSSNIHTALSGGRDPQFENIGMDN